MRAGRWARLEGLMMIENLRDTGWDIDLMKDALVGVGAIPLQGRELRKDACTCCIIDRKKPKTDPTNLICTTKSALGTLSTGEVRDWCVSPLVYLANGRCSRALDIREGAKFCKTRVNPKTDLRGFMECFIPFFRSKGPKPAGK